jgi:hypothetical protein
MEEEAQNHPYLKVPKGLSAFYISRWERGDVQPDDHSVHLLCLAFDLAPYQLGLSDVADAHVGYHTATRQGQRAVQTQDPVSRA